MDPWFSTYTMRTWGGQPKRFRTAYRKDSTIWWWLTDQSCGHIKRSCITLRKLMRWPWVSCAFTTDYNALVMIVLRSGGKLSFRRCKIKLHPPVGSIGIVKRNCNIWTHRHSGPLLLVFSAKLSEPNDGYISNLIANLRITFNKMRVKTNLWN